LPPVFFLALPPMLGPLLCSLFPGHLHSPMNRREQLKD
jgi:hypothetical protein